MTIARPAIFWIAMSAIVVVALVLLRPILMPFAVGMALAYLLAPAVDRLEQIGVNRSLAALALILPLFAGMVGVVVIMLPAIVGELDFFIEQFPRYVARVQALIAGSSRPWLHTIIGEKLHLGETSVKVASTMGGGWLDEALRSLWSGGEALVSLLSLLVVVPIVAIYLLTDWKQMMGTIEGYVPHGRREEMQALGHEIHEAIAGFVRGQILICLILAVFYAIALRAIGLHHAVLIGITAGLVSFVPYLGAGSGFIIALFVAAAQFWPDWLPLLVVGGTFFFGETLADYVLSPRIIGTRVKLNPVWLMFALFAFGYLFGLVGLLIAIPLAASLGAILRFTMRHLLGNPDHGLAPATPFSGSHAPPRLGSGSLEPARSAGSALDEIRPGK
jgi:predicted PurR-regulated permease PerM